MRLELKCSACLCCLLLSWTALAGASLLAYRSPQQLGAESDVVVRGTVESSQSYWNELHTKVYTRVRIAVDETYKGTGAATLDLIQLGGVVGALKVTAHGAPAWRPGEEVLVFAEQDAAGAYRVAGFSQGKFRIVRDAETGEARVLAPQPDEALLLGTPDDSPSRAAGAGVPLDEFVDHALGRASRQGVAR